jgi:branched-subunit amino acid transport protein
MIWVAIVLTGIVSFGLKAVGAALGPPALPERGKRVVVRLAPALLAALVMVDVTGPKWADLSAEMVAGLVVAAGVWWRWRSPVVAVVAAAAATALLRVL